MKTITIVLLCLIGFSAHSQTSKELIGKWKLIKWTKNGEVQDIKATYKTEDVYQVFMEDKTFQGIVGDKTKKGKWKLSDDNKDLTVKISIISVKFHVDYFDARKRIITYDQMGTLEYEKVD